MLSRFSGVWLSSELPNREYRRRLLTLSLGVLGLISFLFYIFPFSEPLYDARANLFITAITWALMPLAMMPRMFFPVIHMSSAGIAASLFYMAVKTGGINSPQTVWLLIFPLPVMLLAGTRVALFWLGVISAGVAGLFVASHQGWIPAQLPLDDNTYTTVVRTITGLSTPTATYTSAQQTTDFGSPQAEVFVRVYQVSATVGRGHYLEGAA
jgi:hypothetical protein